MFSGGDDRSVIVWDINTCKILETLIGHENGVTSLAFAYKDLYTGSFDHHIICWDLQELDSRVSEKQMMREADITSRKFEVYNRLKDAKSGKKKKGKAKKSTKSKPKK